MPNIKKKTLQVERGGFFSLHMRNENRQRSKEVGTQQKWDLAARGLIRLDAVGILWIEMNFQIFIGFIANFSSPLLTKVYFSWLLSLS
jgi:hypothetical protein